MRICVIFFWFFEIMRGFIVKGCNFVQLATCFSLLNVLHGYPTSSNDIKYDEKKYPNGTVIGKYAYLDKEGNPVQVKYYADDSSYGVQLNSSRVVHEQREELVAPSVEQQAKKLDEAPHIPEKANLPETLKKDNSFDFINTFKYTEPKTNKKFQPNHDYLDLLDKKRTAHQKIKYKSPDYEVYVKDDIDSPQQCGANNERVKVYNFVKEAKKAQEVPEEEELSEEGQFCEL